jgi:hypothetical protein
VVAERHGAEDDVSDRWFGRIFGHDSKETSIAQSIQQRDAVVQQLQVVEFTCDGVMSPLERITLWSPGAGAIAASTVSHHFSRLDQSNKVAYLANQEDT